MVWVSAVAVMAMVREQKVEARYRMVVWSMTGQEWRSTSLSISTDASENHEKPPHERSGLLGGSEEGGRRKMPGMDSLQLPPMTTPANWISMISSPGTSVVIATTPLNDPGLVGAFPERVSRHLVRF